ncbi:MAG TPA: MgtC/SapB family protein [Paracoccaceae bacterium]|nr:MgtC/SapB family protein [Paracoccaceae bacterium]
MPGENAFLPFLSLDLVSAGLRLLAALVLGGLIGLERESHARAAGLRTHILVSLAACLFTLLAFELLAMPSTEEERLQFDPLRLIEAVTAGVAFLAAGTIITTGDKVRGVTTGAGMWLAGAIGLACGTGQIVLGGIAALLGLIVLWLLRYVKPALGSHHE